MYLTMSGRAPRVAMRAGCGIETNGRGHIDTSEIASHPKTCQLKIVLCK